MGNADITLLEWLNFDGGALLDTLLWWTSQKITWIPLYLLIVWSVWRKHGTRYALVMLALLAVGVAGVDQLCNLFKNGFEFLRPTHMAETADKVHIVRDYRGGLYGTVSAHAATTSLIAVLTGMAFKKLRYSLLMALWVATVCYSRIYLGVHFPSQILFGIILGTVVGLLLRLLQSKIISTGLFLPRPKER